MHFLGAYTFGKHAYVEFGDGAKAEDGGNLMLWHATPKAMLKTKQQQQLTLQWQELGTQR